jgi:hypothetical protein
MFVFKAETVHQLRDEIVAFLEKMKDVETGYVEIQTRKHDADLCKARAAVLDEAVTHLKAAELLTADDMTLLEDARAKQRAATQQCDAAGRAKKDSAARQLWKNKNGGNY